MSGLDAATRANGRDRAGRSGAGHGPSPLVSALSALFGTMLLGLSFLVAIETLSRKLFGFSFEGADELGGYTLVIGATLAFSIALVERAHIRIDLIHGRLPPKAQAALNWLAVVSLALFGLFMAWICLPVVQDTLAYNSTAQTPWATPLIWPQAVWYAALVVFALIGVWLAARATALLLKGRIEALNADFHPRGANEALQDELEDLDRR